jgi:hypothetical protein
MDYTNRQYLIFQSDQLNKIDFAQVLETSQQTVRKSVDGTKTFVKWEGNQPGSTLGLTNTEGPYTHSQILDILSTEEWTEKIEGI